MGPAILCSLVICCGGFRQDLQPHSYTYNPRPQGALILLWLPFTAPLVCVAIHAAFY